MTNKYKAKLLDTFYKVLVAYEINKTLHIEMLSIYIPYIYLSLIDVQVRLQVSNQSILKIQNIKVVVVNLVTMLWVSIRNDGYNIVIVTFSLI